MLRNIFIMFLISFFISSCATYTMTPEKLYMLLKNGNPKIGETKIYCIDKNGKEFLFAATIHTGIRITIKDGTKQQFYFITSHLQDSTITGSKSAFLNIPIKPIRTTDVIKVEFDGR